MRPVLENFVTESVVKDLASIFEVPESSINSEMELDKGSWDSMKKVEVLASLDHHFDVSAEYSELSQCNTIGDLFMLVERKKS